MRYLAILLLCALFAGPAHAASTQVEDVLLVGRNISSTAQRALVRLHDGDTSGTREFIDISAPTDITTSYKVVLPPAEPLTGEVLIITGVASHVATADWDSPGAGSGITQLTGDVTAGPGTGSQAATIAADAVTFAKMQNISTDRLIGRDTAGTGDPEQLTVTGGVEFTGSAGIQTSAFTGEVTKAAGGTVQTIANDAVVFARMQNIPTDSLVGRDTAGTGDPESITLGTGLAFSGSGTIVNTVTDTDTGITQLTGDLTAGPGSGSQAATIANNVVSYAKLQDVAGYSVVGKATTGSGDAADITAADETVLGRTGGGNLAFAQVATGQIANDAVTFPKMVNINTDSLIGRDTAGTGDPENLGLNSGLTISGGNLVSAWSDDGTNLTPTTSTRRVRSDAGTGDLVGFQSSITGNSITNTGYYADITGTQGVGLTATMSGAGKYGVSVDESSVSGAIGVNISSTGANTGLNSINSTGTNAKPIYGEAAGSGSSAIEGVVSGTSLGQNNTYGVKATRTGIGSWADVTEASAPATPPSGFSREYVKADGLFYGKDDGGTERLLSNLVNQAEVDWGTNLTNDDVMSFTVTDATVTTSQRIIAQVAYEAPSDKDVDELDGQPMTCMCVAGSGQFTLVMQSLEGPFYGKVKINYTIGN